jgi:hypothetical protein
LRPPDFESGASASSATPAIGEDIVAKNAGKKRNLETGAPLRRADFFRTSCALSGVFFGFGDEAGELGAGEFAGFFEVLADELEVGVGVLLKMLHVDAADGFVARDEGPKRLGTDFDEDFAAVGGVAAAKDEAAFFEAVKNMGYRTGSEASGGREPAGGSSAGRPVHDEVDALGVSGVKAEALGDGLVKKDGLSAHLAAEVPKAGENLSARAA